MKILVLSDAIGAPLYAPRVTFLCEELTRHGHEVTLIVEQYEPITFPHSYPLLQVPIYSGRRMDWVVKNIASIVFDYKNRAFHHAVRKEVIGREKEEGKEFDIIVASTCSNFALLAGAKLAEERGIPFVADLRDIAEQASANEYLRMGAKPGNWLQSLHRKVNIKRRNKWLQMADCITSVSSWHSNYLRQLNAHTQLIYNGFDETMFVPSDTRCDYFELVYLGKWYSEQLQDPGLLFEALKGMRTKGILPSELRLVVYSAPECQQRFTELATRYGVADVLQLHDYIGREQVPSILQQASVALVLSNTGAHGILTTKFYEALGVEKPVLCVRSDEGALAELIRYTHAGMAASTTDDVEAFLLSMYQQWKQEGYTRQAVAHKGDFTRQQQVKLFEELFLQLVAQRNM